MRLPARLTDRIAAGLYACLVVFTAIAVVWTMRQGWAVYKLRQGVGDTWFYSADGRPWFRMDEQRRDVSLDQIAPDLQHAVIAVEDHRFYHHFGIDPIGTARAMWRDARGGGRMEGGSTLTQQLARTLFLSNKRTLGRKAQEAVLALLLEQELSKKQILELYLNRVYLSGGVYGVETMSRNLFGTSASRVTLPQAASHRRAHPGPVRALAVVELRRRDRSQPRRPAAHARRRLHHARRGAVGAIGPAADPSVPRRDGCPVGLRQGVPASAVSRPVRRRSSPRLAGADDVRAGAAGRGRARR